MLLTSIESVAQNEVAIGSGTTKSNAILWLNGNGSQGLILPVVTNKSAVTTPDKGMVVYDDSDNKVWYRSNSAWVEVGSGTGASTANLNLLLQGNQLQLRDGTTVLNSANIASGTQTNGAFLVFNGGAWQYATLSGDVTGANGAIQVNGIKGKTIATLPATTQALVYDPTANAGAGGWAFQALTTGTTVPTLNNGQLLTGNGTTNTATTITGDATLSGGALTIGNNAITTAKINAAAVDNTKLADNAVTTAKISDATITGADIAASTITADKLAQSAATTGQVLKWNGTNWVPQNEITSATTILSNGQILTGNGTANAATTLSGDATLSGGALTIGNNAITTAKINAAAVDATKLADGSVTNLKVANDAITSAKITDATITGADIAATTITGANIAATTITADKLAQSGASNSQVLQWNGTNWVPVTLSSGGTVTQINTGNGLTGGPITNSGSIGIAASGVGSTELADNAVVTNKISDNAVTTSKINNSAIDNTKLADNAVTSVKITDATITNADIATNAAIALTKLAPGTNGQVLTTVAGVPAWSAAATGTVTSVTAGAGLTGGTITNSGTVAVNVGTGANQIPQLDGTGKLNVLVIPTSVDANASDDIISGTTAGGDLTGTYPNPTIGVGKVTSSQITDGTIAPVDLSTAGASNGQIIKYNGTNWVLAADDVGAGSVPTLANGQILIGNGASNSAAALSGDGTLNAGLLSVTKIQGTGVSATTPTSNQVLQYDGANWTPATLAAGGDMSKTTYDTNADNIVDVAATATTATSATTAAGLSVTLPLTSGGTGATTAAGARTNLGLGTLSTASTITSTEITDATIATADLSSMGATIGGQVLQWNGSAWAPATLAAGGDMSKTTYDTNADNIVDVAATATTATSATTAAGLSVTLPLTSGGTGATTAAAARTNLGLGTLSTASTITSAEITDGTIAPVDLSVAGASNGQVLKFNGTNWALAADDVGAGSVPTLANGQILIGNGTSNSAAALSGDGTLIAGALTLTNSAATRTNLGLGTLSTASTITSTEITDATIAAVDLSSMGATIGGQVLQWNGTAWAPATLAAGGDMLKSTYDADNNNIVDVAATATTATSATTAAGLSVTLPLTSGGTGATTAAGARTNLGLGTLSTASTITSAEITDATVAAADLSPMGATIGGQVLQWNGTAWAPATLAAGGDMLKSTYDADNNNIVDVAATATTATTATTAAGLSITLPVASGGTGATDASTARTNLGLGSLATLNAVSGANLDPAINISTSGTINSGAITATSFTGDGSGLTNLPAGTTYTAGTGLTLTTNAFSVNTSQNISTLSNLTTNGLIKTSGGTGALSVATAGTDYLAPNGNGSALTNLNAGNITSGTLSIANGGTNSIAAPTNGGVSYGTGTAFGFTAAGTSGQLLQSNGAAAPSWISIPAFLSPSLTSGNIFVGNGSNVATPVALSGDATITNLGALTIADGAISGGTSGKIIDLSITDADINAAAAIAGTKIAPAFGAQAVSTTSTLTTGLTGQFVVDATGNITKLNNLTTSFPSLQGAAGTVLTNDGTGVLTWAAAASGWGLTGNASTAPATQFIGTTDGQDFRIRTNNLERLTVTSAGFVGIGSTTPTAALGVLKGAALATASFAGTNHISHFNFSGPEETFIRGGLTGAKVFLNDTHNGDVILANGGGNVGIGTTSPQATLHINNAAPRLTLTSSVANSANNAQLAEIWFNDALGSSPQAGIRVFRDGNASGDVPTYMSFFTTATGNPSNSEHMRLDKDGNLTVWGGSSVSGNLVFGGALMPSNSAGNAGQVLTSAGPGVAPTWAAAGGNFSTLNTIPKGDGSTLVASSIFDNGNVGIGTSNPLSKLQIDGNQVILNSTASYGFQQNYLSKSIATYIDGNGGWLGTRTNDNLNFFTNNGLPQMTIIPSGNVGIGTTTPAHRLDVAGNINVSTGSGFLINSVRFLGGSTTANNIFLGGSSGGAITSGASNVFVGSNSGQANTTGNSNVFIGNNAGFTNVSGISNVFMGAASGDNNTGSGNTFIGHASGSVNTTGNNNTVLGEGANLGADNLSNATAIGSGAIVSQSNSLVLGNNVNVGIGTAAPSSKLDIAGSIKIVDGTQGAGKVLTSDATGLATWQNASSGWGLNGNGSTVDGTNFIGTTDNVPLNFRVNNQKAGRIDPTGPVFLGSKAGELNADITNTGIGFNALALNTVGYENTAIGFRALRLSTGINNTAVGSNSMISNTTGGENTAIGTLTLEQNTTGIGNTALGRGALFTNVGGTGNTALGFGADVLAPGLVNATAIGQNSKVGANNSLVLGGTGVDAVKVGIGTTTPTARLDIISSGATTGTDYAYGVQAVATGVANPTNGVTYGISGRAEGNGGFLAFGVHGSASGAGGGNYAGYFDGDTHISGGLSVGGPSLGVFGTAGQILTSNGVGFPVTWEDPAGGGWSLTGNASTTPGTNFIGTIGAQDLVFKTNSVEAMRVLTDGNVQLTAIASTARSFKVSDAASGQNGGNLTVQAGSGVVSGLGVGGGNLVLRGGNSWNSGGSGDAGKVQIIAGVNTLGGDNLKGIEFFTGEDVDGLTPLQRMTITSAGNVGIGTATPSALLDIASASNGMRINSWHSSGASVGGASYVGTNIYRNFSDNVWKYTNTHGSIGGAAIQFNGIGGAGTENDILFVNATTPGTANANATVTESMRIKGGSGWVGVGISAPVSPFDVRSTHNGATVHSYNNSTGGSAVGVYGRSDGYAGVWGYDTSVGGSIGVLGSSNNLWGVYGAGPQNGGNSPWTNASDKRLKKNIQTLPNALDNIMKMRGVSFDWRGDEFPELHLSKKHDIGVIAQEINEIYPEVVVKNPYGYYSVSYATLVPVLIEGIKEQQKMIDSLKAQDADSKKKIAALEASLSKVNAGETELASLKSEIEKIKAALGLSVEAAVPAKKEEKKNEK